MLFKGVLIGLELRDFDRMCAKLFGKNQRIYVPYHFMFVFEYINYHVTSWQNRKQKQNLRILSKAYPYLQAMT